MAETMTMPAAYGVEQAVLGAFIFDNGLIDQYESLLREESFYGEQHKIVWRALHEIHDRGGLADAKTLLEFFTQNDSLKKIGGEAYLATLVNNSAHEAELDDYCRVLIDKQNLRAMIRMAREVETESLRGDLEKDSFSIAETAQSTLATIMLGASSKAAIAAKAGIRNVIANTRKAKAEGRTVALKTGIENLDRRLGGGLYPPDLIILAGRPSMGKTQIALNIALGVADQESLSVPGRKASILIESAEMGDDAISTRLGTAHVHKTFGRCINSKNIRNLSISDEWLDEFEKQIEGIGDIYVDDRPAPTVRDIRTRALEHIRKNGVLDLIIIDYLGLIKFGEQYSGNKADNISIITKALKSLAKELNIPILLLAQLSRKSESRDDKRPQLSDLRDSGAIEEDADVVIFAYRERYYLERSEPNSDTEAHAKWLVQMAKHEFGVETIFAKQRLGSIGVESLHFNPETGYSGDSNPNNRGIGSAWKNNPDNPDSGIDRVGDEPRSTSANYEDMVNSNSDIPF